ncbi:polysaccharide pyruvyl transferase family protein [Caballeronia sp. LjRoot31]|uniref:polysaccharide pyruvyl transferase family protein n=1 Tax=Caballeronia sp. LjRoot31 TaxID=3342324 RepID=UPI003ECE50A5
MDLEPMNGVWINDVDVIWAYRMLLGRDPESQSTIDECRRLPSIGVLRNRIMRSTEFQNILCGKQEQWGPYAFDTDANLRADLVWHSRLHGAEIDLAYKAILGRDLLASDVLEEHLSRNDNLFSLVTELILSDENADNHRKLNLLECFKARVSHAPKLFDSINVMLFGAFGNGNVGDQCQAAALHRLVSEASETLGKIGISACSWENVNASFEGAQLPLARDEILNASALQSTDLLLIGGGGLLSTPHFPLHNELWVNGLRALGCKYALVGVGATSAELAAPGRMSGYKNLLEGALFVTGRDLESVTALRAYRPDTQFMADPFFATSAEIRFSEKPSTKSSKIVLIPKNPVNANEEKGLAALVTLQAELRAKQVETITLLFEPHMDGKIAGGFENVIRVTNWAEAIEIVGAARTVFTMRYHGALFALASRVSALCISIPKIRDLYQTLGLERFIVGTERAVMESEFDFTDEDWKKVDQYLVASRAAAANVKNRIAAALGSTLS